MNSHFQSSDTTSTSSGFTFEAKGCAGSSSCAPIQAMPPKNVIGSSGIDHTTSSIRPDCEKSGRYNARSLSARYHHAKAIVATMIGPMIANMITTASINIAFSATPTGPDGERRKRSQPDKHEANPTTKMERPTFFRTPRPSSPWGGSPITLIDAPNAGCSSQDRFQGLGSECDTFTAGPGLSDHVAVRIERRP